ncbi:MAG TPA: DUF4126 domain-containing protein [Blastocatellia bacterium]|nr:DUF4126 domain-containing protein [Blastocatellia bacterium]
MPTGNELTAFLVVVCFAAGLNVYATVIVLGLLSHAQLLTLPTGLHLLENWYVLTACFVLYLVEFVGDKIPVFDLLWNAIQTFVRVPVAALLAYGATTHLPDWEQLLATLLGGLIALAAHGGKTALRATVAHSPEPFSNSALSLGEDATVVFLLWYATRHPYVAAGIAVVALLVIAVTIRAVVRAMRRLFRNTEGTLAKKTGDPSC